MPEGTMIRTQIQLEDAQYRALKELALARSVSMAELMREGVNALLQREDRNRRWAALWESVGSCRETEDDGTVSVRHDDHLAEIYRG
jgi:predicted DNA-binding ribbon-helix-helix protein